MKDDSDFKLFDNIGGLNIPTTDMVTVARINMLGSYGGDTYVMFKFRTHHEKFWSLWLKRGYFPRNGKSMSDEEAILSHQLQESLSRYLEAELSNAFWHVHGIGDQYFRTEGHRAILFIKCNDGIIGAGWYENQGSSKKALRMCAFLLYALGYINVRQDPVLWSAAVEYLIDDARLIPDQKTTGAIIQSSIRAKLLDQPFGGIQLSDE